MSRRLGNIVIKRWEFPCRISDARPYVEKDDVVYSHARSYAWLTEKHLDQCLVSDTVLTSLVKERYMVFSEWWVVSRVVNQQRYVL